MPSNLVTITRPDGAGPGETLYDSASTRVVRSAEATTAGSVVWKGYLGSRAAQRLRNERSMLRRLAAVEGVVQLAEGAEGGDVLVLRDCGGISLAQVLQAGKCDIATVLSLACQLARILAAVHRAGVIHWDINPTNVLVTATGQAVLIDFDLAVLAAHRSAVEPHGQLAGTLSYMAPEQTGRTGHPVDQRADLYALGATLYEMATGHPPFEQADALQLIHDHLVREPEPPWQVDSTVPRGLSNIALRLLAKEPEQRYQSAEGLLYDLQRLRGELEQGRGDVFELGERDFAARLAPPARLIGRDTELQVLRKAFSDAMDGPLRTVLIEGPTGAGKSALMNELRPVVAEAGGWFVYGKFDQYQRDGSTSGALTQALRALGRLLLTQSSDEVAAQRQRILHSLGRNVAMIIRASPEFALLLGDEHDVVDADPRQAELQLKQAILDLLGAIASPRCPIVLVVDDLQWAGSFSLRLFERMMTAMELRGLLLVGAYRSGDRTAAHDFAPMLARWQEHEQLHSHIVLTNLTSAGISELTRQMLRLAPEQSRELAEAVNVLTAGNPFDTVEMINALRADGVLSLEQSGWQWNPVKVRRFIGRGNVVDLLAARIGRLPAASRELLECMSCLRSEVECKLLCAAVGIGDDELRVRLRAPLEDGLLVADQPNGQDSVRFRHDRVQQVMLDAMDDGQRGERQLAMARRLAMQPAFAGDAAEQYLGCVNLLDDAQEQRRVAHSFHGVAQALASTATYMLAERYLANADGLLARIDAPGDAALRLAIDVARHRALYSLGRADESDPLYASIRARKEGRLDLVEPTCLQITSLSMRGRTSEALILGASLLERLGLHVPQEFNDPDIPRRLDALAQWVSQERDEEYSMRPRTQDPRWLGIYKLLPRMFGAAYQGRNPNAFAWVVLEGQRLWAENGPASELMSCMANLGAVLISWRQDYKTAYDVGRHVIAVGEALGFEVRTAASRFAYSLGTCPWFEPLESALDQATRGYEVFQAKGDDASFASYFNIPRYIYLLETAPSIAICDAEIEAGMVQCRRSGNVHALVLHTLERQFLRALRGQTRAPDSFDDEQFDEQTFLAKVGGLPDVDIALLFYRGFQAALWGDLAVLSRHAPFIAMSESRNTTSGLYRVTYNHLFAVLARAWQLQQGDPSAAESAPLIAELEACRSWLAGRAADQPYNFLHLLRLVEAEQAWALRDMWKAAVAFDDAVLEADTRQRPWHRALITERAGLFNLARGLTGAGRALLAKARDQYEAWGAMAKVDQMDRQHAFLQAPARSLRAQFNDAAGPSHKGSASVSSDVLDLLGVLRASQALSSATSLEQLTTRVTEVLAALSGATNALVLSWDDGQWRLLAPAPSESALAVTRAAERGMVPLSAVAYAERTGEALVVDDAIADDRFARDPYFAGVPVCSLLLVPIASQGTTRAMLVLENRLGRAAFNAQRLDAVMLIAGQLAVSLANARLYESLEQRVQARTRELQEIQAQLMATARRAGMAEVANNVLHNVGNVFNSITVSTSMVRANLARSKLAGLRKAMDLMNAHEQDIGDFMSRDPKGKAWRVYLNELVAVLDAERGAVLEDLDRLARSVEHVNHVLATQQSHAGSSRLLELDRLDELMEEALQMSGETLVRCGIRVVRHYEDTPAVPLDKSRLLQILVNLIANAAEAMQGAAEACRQLTVGVGLVPGSDGASGKRLSVTVRDQGEGIAPDNLTRVFAHGFTTRSRGHGFGLHSSAVAAIEMGGRLTAHSDGPGRGAVFALELPIEQ